MQWIILYPLYATVMCIKKPMKNDLLHWCVWWTVYQSIQISNTVLWWFPLIDTIENTGLFLLYSSIFTSYIRNDVIIKGMKTVNKRWPGITNVYNDTQKLIKNGLTLLFNRYTHNSLNNEK